MRQQQKVIIEGWTYDLVKLGALEGRQLVILFTQLLSRVLPLFGKLSKGVSKGEGADAEPKVDPDALAAIASALDGIEPAKLEPLWDAFASNAWVIGKDGRTRQQLSEIFDEHFSGEYFAMVKFFVESAKFNFGSFLGKALSQASDERAPHAPTP